MVERDATDIFIVGPARSGTSWLQTMLAEHPDIASPPETHLFMNYLAPLAETWALDQARVAAALGERGKSVGHGLATVVTDDEFVALMQSFYATFRELVLSAKPGARRLFEKTPDHAVCLDTILRISPEAQIVYLVRDPRDTVRSLLEAGDEVWGDWAPTSVEDATTLWLRNVQPWFPRKRDPRITLVRYEDLRSNPAELERVADVPRARAHRDMAADGRRCSAAGSFVDRRSRRRGLAHAEPLRDQRVLVSRSREPAAAQPVRDGVHRNTVPGRDEGARLCRRCRPDAGPLARGALRARDFAAKARSFWRRESDRSDERAR